MSRRRTPPPPSPPPIVAAPRQGSIALRLFWTFLGPAGLGLLALYIGLGRSTQPRALDAVYGLAALAVVAARWIDGARLHGVAADGAPSTSRSLRRFAFVFLAAAAGAWGLARALGSTIS